MSKNHSYIELLKEMKELYRSLSHQSFHHPEMVSTLREELLRRTPSRLKKLGLSAGEIAFMATLAIGSDSYDDVLAQFLRFWCPDAKDHITLNLELRRSLTKGRLKKFVQLKGDRWIISEKAGDQIVRGFLD